VFLDLGWEMPLTRKTRLSGSSIVINIPSQLVEAYNITSGDYVEIIPMQNNEIKIKKIKPKKQRRKQS
jgi:antitoxin component of MazEF toxin-antitoxin module